MRIQRYCLCGGVLDVTGVSKQRQRILSNWYGAHDGPECGDTDVAKSEQARTGSGQPDGREAARAERNRR